MLRIAAAALLAAPLLAAAPPALAREAKAAPAINAELAAAVADPRRAEDRARDRWRKPAETLAFFRVEPGMKVAEFAPGGGWYSRILGMYLGPRGRLVGLYFNPEAGRFSDKAKQGIRDGAANFPAQVAGWSGQPAERFAGMTLETVPDAEKGTFDRILIMRMVHNMHRNGMVYDTLTKMRDLLKDDGMIGVEQHRARPGAPYSYANGARGYMTEKDVIALFEAHGFELVGKSEVNANPADPADWPDGVWTLPPMLSKKDVDRAKYEAIGESDRMTLLFRKRP